ncbi:uncharacterized protein LOC103523915 [Trichonephila clavipes]|nr:uncharacterized protein LOC103523915 [Trichonephila clavipes]
MGIDGKEKTDLLTKGGALESEDNKPLLPESLKNPIFQKLVDYLKSDQAVKLTDKSWANMQGTWDFTLQTDHDCMVHHLDKICFFPSNTCKICNAGIMNADPFLICPEQDTESQKRGEISKLYWNARTFMNSS